MGLDSEASWGIIYINLCYAPQLHWYVTHTGFNEEYSKAYLGQMMIESGAKENWVNDIFSSLTRMSELPLGDIGLGHATREKIGSSHSQEMHGLPQTALLSSILSTNLQKPVAGTTNSLSLRSSMTPSRETASLRRVSLGWVRMR